MSNSIKPPVPTFHTPESRARFRNPGNVKFDDALKEKFLQYLSEHGKSALACQEVGIDPSTYHRHIKNDPEFAEAVEETIGILNAKRALQIEREALKGTIRQQFNGRGELVGETVVYETKLREMILKKSDPSYRETISVDTTVRGGCLVLPAVVSPSDWEQQYTPIIKEIQREQQKQLEEGRGEDE